MSNDARFGFDDTLDYTIEKPPRSWLKSCFIGCLWTSAVLAVVATVIGFWIARNWREWMADMGAGAVKQSIEATELPEAEKDEIGEQIDRVAVAFREGKITGKQLSEIVNLLIESPLATTLVVEIAEHKYFNVSDLSDEEKTEGRRTLRRFARGAIDGTIDERKRDRTLIYVAEHQAGGGWRLRDRVTNEELREFLAEAKNEADAAGIAEEPEVVDPSEELRRIVDEALGAPLAEAPEEPLAETPEEPMAEAPERRANP